MNNKALHLYAEIALAIDRDVGTTPADNGFSEWQEIVSTYVDSGVWHVNENDSELLRPSTELSDGKFTELPSASLLTDLWLLTRDGMTLNGSAAALLDKTIVRTLSTYRPAAFTTRIEDEYLIVVDNAFHDLLYNFVKFMVLSTGPADDGDATWRSGSMPGRLMACARIFRLILGSLRWLGICACPARAMLPRDLSSLAMDLTEGAQIFVLAHEAEHVRSGHLSVPTQTVLGVGSLSVPTIECNHELETSADVGALATLANVYGETDREQAIVQAMQSVHILFTLMELFDDAYFVVPPPSHPRASERLDRVAGPYEELLAERQTRDEELAHPFLTPVSLLAGTALVGDLSGLSMDDLTLGVSQCRYMAWNPAGKTLRLDVWKEIDHLQDVFSTPLILCLAMLGEIALQGPIGRLPESLRAAAPRFLDRIQPGVDDDMRAQEQRIAIAAESARQLLTRGVDQTMVALRSLWTPSAGTPFHRWAADIAAVVAKPLYPFAVPVCYAVVKGGPEALPTLDSEWSRSVEAWLRSENVGLH